MTTIFSTFPFITASWDPTWDSHPITILSSISSLVSFALFILSLNQNILSGDKVFLSGLTRVVISIWHSLTTASSFSMVTLIYSASSRAFLFSSSLGFLATLASWARLATFFFFSVLLLSYFTSAAFYAFIYSAPLTSSTFPIPVAHNKRASWFLISLTSLPSLLISVMGMPIVAPLAV